MVQLFNLVNPFFFMQNDDWVYYINVENFLNGNFALHPLTAPTFYTQGILGYLFALIFGIQSLPFLTLIIFILSSIIFYRLIQHQIDNKLAIILISLTFFTVPLYVYTSIGFMTDAYLIFFMILYAFSFNMFCKDKSKKHLAYLYLISIAGFFTKQVMLVMPISTAIYFLIQRKIKLSTAFFLISIILFSISKFAIPQTAEMSEKSLLLSNLLNTRLTLEVIYTSVFYACTFAFPLISILFFQNMKTQKYKWVLISFAILIGIVLYTISNNLTYFAKEFPFVDNTFTRKGFFPGEIPGNKYHMRGFYDIFNGYQALGAISIGMLIVSYYKKKSISIYSIFFLVYLGIMLIVPRIYDRYYIPLILFGLLELSTLVKWNLVKYKILLAQIPILILTSMISYQFCMDFITMQTKAWNINTTDIQKTRAYNNYYKISSNTGYYISYDKSENHVSEIRLDFPFSLFIDPKIYINKK